MQLDRTMNEIITKFPINTRVAATWDEYLRVIEDLQGEKAKCYYNKGQLYIEMTPLGNDHASDHTIIMLAVNLFATFNEIDFNGKDNATIRKSGLQDAQPDASYYIGKNADAVGYGTSIIELDSLPAPDLVIEIANSSLADDKGEKRLLYEDMGVGEYWIVDVQKAEIIAFSVADGGSKRIKQSLVLPGLSISTLEEALQKSRKNNQRIVATWLMKEFHQKGVTNNE